MLPILVVLLISTVSIFVRRNLSLTTNPLKVYKYIDFIGSIVELESKVEVDLLFDAFKF